MPYPRLSLDDSKRLAARISDLKKFNVAAVALLRGEASIYEDHTMAGLASAGKTKTIVDGSQRRFVTGFQPCLDDAARLAALSDVFKVFHGKAKDIDANASPADALILADRHTDDVKGMAMLANAYSTIQSSRSALIAIKAKYGAKFFQPATLTLEDKPKRVNEVSGARKEAQEALSILALLKQSQDPAIVAFMSKINTDQANAKASWDEYSGSTAAPATVEPEVVKLAV